MGEAAAAASRILELEGQVLIPPQARRPRRSIVVTISQVGTSFNKETRADSSGRFRFKNLQPSIYSLSVHIPGTGEIVQTVDVTPSFADDRGKVQRKFVFDQETLARQARPLATGVVSVRELSIPRGAHREYQKGRDAASKQNLQEAIEHFEKAIAQAPQYMEAYNNLGIVYFQQHQFSRAESNFRKALELEPEAFEPLVNLGGTLLALDRIDEAIEVNSRAHDTRPQDALATAQLGLSHFLAGQDEDALNYLLLTEELDPAHFTNPQLPLAQIYLRHSEGQAALEELEDFLRYHPDSPEAPSVRATIERIEITVEAAQTSAN
jgi:tetratricopeptide (TPR) repeat protein